MRLRSSTSSSSSGLRFSLRCVVFAVAIAMSYGGLYLVYPTHDTPPAVDLFRRHVDEGAEVLYFGDSTLFYGAVDDTDHATTPTMLQRHLPDLDVRGVYDVAYSVKVFAMYAQALVRDPGSVKTVVFPLNLRLMAPQVGRHGRQFKNGRRFLRYSGPWFRLVHRPLRAFRAFEASAQEFGQPIAAGPFIRFFCPNYFQSPSRKGL